MSLYIQIGLGILAGLALSASSAVWAAPKENNHQKNYSTQIVMLGDSLTQNANWPDYFPKSNIINLGVGGDTVSMVEERLEKATSLKPKRIFLMVGINDLGSTYPPQTVVEGHKRLWDQIQAQVPDTELIVLSILPVIEAKTSFRVSNKSVVNINQQLARLAEKRGLKFVDLYSPMADNNGELKKELTRDGVHLTPVAYEIWVSRISHLVLAP